LPMFDSVALQRSAQDGFDRSQQGRTRDSVAIFSLPETLSKEDEENLLSAIRESSTATAVLDLAQLRSLGAAGLGTLVLAASVAVAAGTRLRLMNVLPGVESFLRNNHLLDIFDMCSPREVITLWCRAVKS
jgi:anti-anti-sigma factor